MAADLERVKVFDASGNVQREAENRLKVISRQILTFRQPVFQWFLAHLHYHYRSCHANKQTFNRSI